MLASLKRWFNRDKAALPWADIEAWAKAAGHRFARAKEGEGFVIDGSNLRDASARVPAAEAQRPWRLEWGPPQRAYIAGRELRIRMELGLPAPLQMLLMARGLMESLESEIFERSTQDLQTHVDMSTPEEMRWLSMFAKSPLQQRVLRGHFGGVSNDPALLTAWVADELAASLEAACAGMLKDGPPFLLMTLRGRLYLRVQLAEAGQAEVAQAVAVFEAAVPAALQVAAAINGDIDSQLVNPSTAWQNQFPPGKE